MRSILLVTSLLFGFVLTGCGDDSGSPDLAADLSAAADLSMVNACTTAGGQCVAVGPSSCPNGHIGGAMYSCGSGVGSACCLPGGPDGGTPTTCTAAGGTCVAVGPGNCASGHVGDASLYTCGGGVGSECCLP